MDFGGHYKLVEQLEEAAETCTIRSTEDGNIVGYLAYGALLKAAAWRIRSLQRWRLTWFLCGALFGVAALIVALLIATHFAELQRAEAMKQLNNELRGTLRNLQPLMPLIRPPVPKTWNPTPATERDA